MLRKKIAISLFTIISTLIAIYLNWSKFFMGHPATVFNFIVSTVFILIWFVFSFFWGIKQEKSYKKFILVYWGLNYISFILMWIISLTKFPATFLFLFSIWYGGPIYGFRYLIKADISSLSLITAPLGLIISFLGYTAGRLCSK